MVDDTNEDENSKRNVPKQIGKIRIVTGKSLVRSRVVFSKDTKSLFCGYGNNIRVHNVKTGDIVSVFKGHTGEVSDLCLSMKNPLQLLSCCLDGYVNYWDIIDGTIISQRRCDNPLYGISVHKDHPSTLFLVHENKTKERKEKRKFILSKAHVELKSKGGKKELAYLKCKKVCEIDKAVGSYSFSSQGQLVASVCDNSLQVWNFKTKQLKRYSSKGVICVAFHPVDLCVATGNTEGVITIWRNLSFDSPPIYTKLHWHAHPVESIAFSFDGAYLYSGAEEAVLVFWQFETGHKQFKPRLGAPIAHICNSPDDTVIAVCHTNNVINLVSAVDLSVVNVVQGLTKANHLHTGLVADPLSKAIVLNSQDGTLQFYRPDIDGLAFTLNIVSQNYISKPDKKPLQMTRVEQVSFSPNGDWLATVEGRDDGKTTPEIRLKFWKYDTESQRHVLNTCIDPPHDGKVVSVEFQPGIFYELRAMSAAVDGKFKIWILKEQQVIKGVRQAWQCQSVGYLRDEPVETATFSSDGSLLAVAYGEAVTIWDPCTNELKTTLYSPFSQTIKDVKFGRRSCSHILLVSTKHDYLIAWSLLSCSVLWSVEAEVNTILSDPLSHLMAVFTVVREIFHVYIFDPRSAVPVCVVPNVIKNGSLASACFQPNIKGVTINQTKGNLTMAKLFIMNEKQVLLTVDDKKADWSPLVKEISAEPKESEFHRIFGEHYTSDPKPDISTPSLAQHRSSSSKVIKEILSAPSHVLPPTTTLCSTLLSSLLINKQSDSGQHADDMDENDVDQSLGSLTSDDETQMTSFSSQVRENEEEKQEKAEDVDNEQTLKGVCELSFEWMKDFFDGLE